MTLGAGTVGIAFASVADVTLGMCVLKVVHAILVRWTQVWTLGLEKRSV